MENTLQVANTILQQLGGGRFSVMTGSRNFMGSANNLRFRLPSNFARNGINLVSITLTDFDTYDIEFLKVRGAKLDTIAKHAGVYCDQLRSIFTAETGLAVSL